MIDMGEAVEKESYFLCKNYGINEWHEKCIVLSLEERRQVLKDIQEGIESELLDIVKLPFPKFITTYYLRYYSDSIEDNNRYGYLNTIITKDVLKNDPAIGYKLFLVPEGFLKYVNSYIKKSDAHIPYCSQYNYLLAGADYLTTDLENTLKIGTATKTRKEAIKKFIYIMRYVDKEEAEKLHLTGHSFYRFGEYSGFDLEGKLASLNPCMRTLVKEYLGLNGYSMKDVNAVFRKMGMREHIECIFSQDDFLRNMMLSTGAFQNYLGMVEKDYAPKERIEYNKKGKYYKASRLLEAHFIYGQLPQEEKNIIGESKIITPDVQEYLISKYIDKIEEMIQESEQVKMTKEIL